MDNFSRLVSRLTQTKKNEEREKANAERQQRINEERAKAQDIANRKAAIANFEKTDQYLKIYVQASSRDLESALKHAYREVGSEYSQSGGKNWYGGEKKQHENMTFKRYIVRTDNWSSRGDGPFEMGFNVYFVVSRSIYLDDSNRVRDDTEQKFGIKIHADVNGKITYLFKNSYQSGGWEESGYFDWTVYQTLEETLEAIANVIVNHPSELYGRVF